MAEIVLITGLSGAGRSGVADVLEDLGWFVIDNLPPALMTRVADFASDPDAAVDHVALVVGTGEYRDQIVDALKDLNDHPGLAVRTVFLQARTPVLVRRYEATRRLHPFRDYGSLADAIEAERRALEPVADQADVVIDTSDLNVHELRTRIIDLFGGEGTESRMRTRVMSFGYKHGIPLDVDLVLDCRFLPNPHWVEELRPQTGKDDAVRDYVLGQPLTEKFLEQLRVMLATLMPAFIDEGKAYLSIALGCTGGRHRSVAIAEEVAAMLTELGHTATVTHRDVDRSA